MQHSEGLGHHIRKVNNKIVKVANAQLKELDITFSQMEILMFLCSRRDQVTTPKDVEEEFKLTHPTVLGVLERLKKKDLIRTEVDESDGRKRNIILLDKMFEMEKQVSEKRIQLERALESKMSAEKLEEIKEIMNIMFEALCEME